MVGGHGRCGVLVENDRWASSEVMGEKTTRSKKPARKSGNLFTASYLKLFHFRTAKTSFFLTKPPSTPVTLGPTFPFTTTVEPNISFL